MFPGMPVQTNKHERKLVKLFKSLDATDKATLVAFAEFLQIRAKPLEDTAEALPELPTEPLDIPRPEKESVIKAIKRLSATYPMVNKEDNLHPISGLMTSHILQGRKANDVIDELELLFLKEYQKLNNNLNNNLHNNNEDV